MLTIIPQFIHRINHSKVAFKLLACVFFSLLLMVGIETGFSIYRLAQITHTEIQQERLMHLHEPALLALQNEQQSKLMVFVILAGLVFGLLFFAIHRFVLKPLQHLTIVAQRLLAGDYSARVDWQTTDEFGQLGRTLDTLADHASRTQALSEMRDRLDATLNALPDLLFVVDDQGTIHDFRANTPNVLQASPTELIGRQVSTVLPAEIVDPIMNALQQTGCSAPSSMRLETAFGSHWFELFLAIKEKATAPHDRFVMLLRDISDRKRVEQKMRRSEQQFRRLVDSNIIGIQFCNTAGTIIDANAAFLHMTGYERSDLPLDWRAITPPEWLPCELQSTQQFSETGNTAPWEKEYIRKDGSRIPVLLGITELDEQGQAIAFVLDLSERKRMEESLRKSEERFKAIVESTTDCILVWDREYNYLYANQAAINHVDTTRDKVIGKNIRDGLGHIPDFMQLWMHRVDQVFATEQPMAVEDSMPVGEQMIYSESRLSPIRDTQGQMFAVGVVYRDVTSRKLAELELEKHRNHLADLVREQTTALEKEIAKHQRTEVALRNSEARYRAIVEFQSECICRFLLDTTLTFVNQAYCRFFRRDRNELIGRSFLDLVPKEDHADILKHVRTLAANPRVMTYEHAVIVPNGGIRWQQWTDQAITDENGRVIEFQSVGRDITDRKLAEEHLKTSLQEKEVLLKEIHHRVKNNLQVISSLLDLQADFAEDAAVRQLFRESQHRVRSMALIHERLYQSVDLARIDFAEYASNLTRYLLQSYASDNVDLHAEIEPIRLSVETAVPCGLIINELVSNALKHAFPNTRPGQITIELKPRDNQQAVLRIADNGIGLAPNVDLQHTQSLGLMIVTALVQQLQGNMQVDRTSGTVITITFKPFTVHKELN